MKVTISANKDVTVDVSFDSGLTKSTYDLISETPLTILAGKNATAGNICPDITDIRIYTKSDDNYITATYSDTAQYFFNRETDNTIYCKLEDLESTLAGLAANTVDTAYQLKIIGINGDVASFDTINTLILAAEKYIDLSPTRFHHTDISEAQTTTYNSLSTVTESDGSLRFTNPFLFPKSFAGNTFITGITIPKEDNYIAGSFIDCTNLKNVYIEDFDNKAWIASGYIKNSSDRAISCTTTNGTYINELVNLDLGYSFKGVESISIKDSEIIAELLRTGAGATKKAFVISTCWTKHQG